MFIVALNMLHQTYCSDFPFIFQIFAYFTVWSFQNNI